MPVFDEANQPWSAITVPATIRSSVSLRYLLLPNGRELVVLRNDEEGSVLYGPVCCKPIEKGEFVVNKAGRLVCQGKLTELQKEFRQDELLIWASDVTKL